MTEGIADAILIDLRAETGRACTWATRLGSRIRGPLELIDGFLSELEATRRKLHAWVLVYQRFVQLAEVAVLSLYYPGRHRVRHMEGNLNDVLRVSPMVARVLQEKSVIDVTVEPDLEEMRPVEVVQVFRAGFGVVEEYLSGVERVAELALTGHAVLEALRVGLVLLQFGIKFVVPCLLLANGLTEHAVGLLDLLELLLELVDLLFILLGAEFTGNGCVVVGIVVEFQAGSSARDIQL